MEMGTRVSSSSSSFSSYFSSSVYLMLWCAIVMGIIMVVSATDPAPLQDFCVADTNSTTRVNGFVCKNPANATGSDFASIILRTPGNASASKFGYVAVRANAANFPGLNTLGLSASRTDFNPGGVNPPHVHPRGSELIYVLQGTLFAGFVSSDEKLFSATLYAGDLFIIPQGLIHFQMNVGETHAVGIVSFNSQNPGTSRIPGALFASHPAIDDALLARSFGVNATEIQYLKKIISSS